ncbi:MAG: hypothetical protein V1836_02120 [Candidatus Aenigmatarchaeota archaeon]
MLINDTLPVTWIVKLYNTVVSFFTIIPAPDVAPLGADTETLPASITKVSAELIKIETAKTKINEIDAATIPHAAKPANALKFIIHNLIFWVYKL